MVAMSAWLAVAFEVFGLLAPRNAVVRPTIVTCALCVDSVIFLIDDYDATRRASSMSHEPSMASGFERSQGFSRPAIGVR